LVVTRDSFCSRQNIVYQGSLPNSQGSKKQPTIALTKQELTRSARPPRPQGFGSQILEQHKGEIA
jgi:hypothetical protein